MRNIKWLGIYFALVLLGLGCAAGTVYKIDPFMHYHQPDVDNYYYSLDNERSMNDGITKHFQYNALITGTSMTENFKTTEADGIFGVESIKVPYSGGSYKEINDNLKVAFEYNPKLELVIRCLDMGRFFDSKDTMRNDLGDYPTYLYNHNPFDDVDYLLNRDILYGRCWEMIKSRYHGESGGITSFDAYANWMPNYTFGSKTVLNNHEKFENPQEEECLSLEEKNIIRENITENVTDLADKYPDADFYYFISPYSIVWWGEEQQKGRLDKDIAAEKYIIELILPHKNIHLYSWNTFYDITCNLNNYKDTTHYGIWINTHMLNMMKNEVGLLTEDNYRTYISEERLFYSNFPYNILFKENDLKHHMGIVEPLCSVKDSHGFMNVETFRNTCCNSQAGQCQIVT